MTASPSRGSIQALGSWSSSLPYIPGQKSRFRVRSISTAMMRFGAMVRFVCFWLFVNDQYIRLP